MTLDEFTKQVHEGCPSELVVYADEEQDISVFPKTVELTTVDGKIHEVPVVIKPKSSMEETQQLKSFMEERQRKIAEDIARNGRILTGYIQRHYNVGYETARRDLEQLEKAGLCKRTHGGAIAVEQVNVRPPYDRDFATMKITDDYLSIAKLAASQIRKNDCIYLTSGSLGHLMLKFLPTDFFYTVVVNAADMAKELRAFTNFDVYVAGGKMRQSGSIVDSMARDFVSRLHFDTCFLTGGGITVDFGLSNGTDETASFQREVLKNSRRKVLLMPSKKIGRDSFVKVCPAEEFDEIITDWEVTDEELTKLKELGVSVSITEEPK